MHIYQILAIYGPKLLIFHGKFSKLRPVIGHGHRDWSARFTLPSPKMLFVRFIQLGILQESWFLSDEALNF